MLPQIGNQGIENDVNPIYLIDNKTVYIPWKAAQDIHLCYIRAMYEDTATFGVIKRLHPVLDKMTLGELRTIWNKMSKPSEKLKFVEDIDVRWGLRRAAIKKAHDESMKAGEPASG